VGMSAPLAAPPAWNCVVCRRAITADYFLAGTKIVCPECRDRIANTATTGSLPAAIGTALLFGAGAAVAAAAGWAAIVFFLHMQLGIAAIAVGWAVGTAVRKGAGTQSGILFQVIAVLLTACSLAWSTIPLILQAMDANGGGAPLSPFALAFSVTAGPFLAYGFQIAHDPFTLVFLGIALFQAYRLNGARKVLFTGPHRVAAAIDFSNP
jgi:hypothetical protein